MEAKTEAQAGGGRAPGPVLPSAGPGITEADLAAIWEAKRFPPGSLTTSEGRPVEVLSPGWRRGVAGPDYRDAVVAVRGQRFLGDVELHVRASSFRQHGHHLDRACNGLVLHVVFLDDCAGESRIASGRLVPVAAFAPWVLRRSDDIAAWLARPALWREPCEDSHTRLGADAIRDTLREAGRQRFLARASSLAEEIRELGPENALWAAVMEALGYGCDRDGFRRLALDLPPARLRAAAALAVPRDRSTALEAELVSAARGLFGRALATRPANRPERRLAGAAALFMACDGYPVVRARRALNSTALAARADWSVAAPSGGEAALVGAARAGEVVVTAVLPFLAAQGEEERALALAAALPPTPAYGKTRFLERNLGGGGRRRTVRNVLEQQGLLALHTRWCSRGRCGACPLSAASGASEPAEAPSA